MSLTQTVPKSEYGSRGMVELNSSDPEKLSYTGEINAIVLGAGCEFPDNETGCITELGGINLHHFTTNYPIQARINCLFSKVTITAGRCFLEVK